MPNITIIPTAQAVTAEGLVPLLRATGPDAGAGFGPPAVVIDALRATSTIASALAAGVRSVIPVASVEEARGRKAEGVLVAGERGGDRLPGFDLGNSPVEVRAAAGQTLVLTTTNGTLATRRLLEAVSPSGGRPMTILAGAFVNRARVARALRQRDGGALLVCAGQDGHPAAEDLLAAGAVVAALPASWVRDDLAVIAEWAFLEAVPGDGNGHDGLLAAIERCPHGTSLRDKGYGADLRACADLDGLDVLPTLHEIDGTWAFVAHAD